MMHPANKVTSIKLSRKTHKT